MPYLRDGSRPKEVTAEATGSENAELVDVQCRFVVSAVLTVPLFLVAMADMLPGDPVGRAVGIYRLPWIELALSTPVVIWGGWPFFVLPCNRCVCARSTCSPSSA